MDVLSPSLTQAVHEAKAVRAHVRDCMVDLEEVLTGPTCPDEAAWWDRMRVSLGGLREAFRRHVAVTQAPGGVLDEVVADAPPLAHAREQLIRDHIRITLALDRLWGPDLPPGGVVAAREAAIDLLGVLSRHRHRGADFVFEAYELDIAGGDDELDIAGAD